ncbi:MAG: type II toxin-antitoxin system RelE/ParE family toxin [Desulfobacteria bacterium]|nr:type II toxin-antitoxin system RelE/ParE family toxin [Deltaproteobacteria bacterium]
MKRAAGPVAVSFGTSAVADLEEIKRHYGELSAPEAAERFLAEILKNVEKLMRFPMAGRIVPEFGVEFLREVVVPPFRVVYRVDPGRIRIVRVRRSERLLEIPEG